MFHMKIKAVICPTEDEDKIKKAVKNIFDINLKKEGNYIMGESTRISSLNILKEKLKDQAIRDTARSILLNNLTDKKLSFSLNKQAAFVGVVNFQEESKLGVMEVEIESDDIMRIIDLIAPSTI